VGAESKPELIAQAVLAGGGRVLQYRGKEKSAALQLQEARALRSLTDHYGATLVINDRPDIALLCNADGVHLGAGDLPISTVREMMGEEKLIGATAHSTAQARQAQDSGADYVGFGSVFHTRSKSGAVVQGTKGLARAVEATEIPVIGIGGVNRENAAMVLRQGAYGVAVLSSVTEAQDPAAATREMLVCLKRQMGQGA
jgi:thiamine-phosphate diphosphorylase